MFTGNFDSWSSGGGNYHVAWQLKDGRIIQYWNSEEIFFI